MLKKSKIFLFLSLLLSTSVVSPLTSCGSDGSTNDVGGFDKEFGFDVQTYNRLENEFKIKYKNQLLNDSNVDKNVAFDKYENFLQNDITSIRNQLFDPAQNYSFTVRTNALIDYASKNYNIYLNRNADVSESAFNNLKQSSLENFIIYLDNVYGINDDEKNEQITNFSTKFNSLLSKYCHDYTDNAEILIRLRASIIECWDSLNQEFALLSAYNHLRDFFDEYDFIVKDQSDKQTDINELLWDNLLDNEKFITNGKTGLIDQDIDCKINDEWIDKIFTIIKKKNHTDSNSSSKQDSSTFNIHPAYNEIKSFNSQEIIPGYTLTPVLKTMSQDIYANNYYMNIDWQLVSNNYDDIDDKTKKSITAHFAYKIDGTNNNLDHFSSSDHQFTKYQLLATPEQQKNNFKMAYFTNTKQDQKIVFNWDEEKTSLEHFLPSDGEQSIKQQYDLPMSIDNLSNAHLKINNKLLSTLLFNIEGKIPHSKDDAPTNNNSGDDDSDATLSIEEKFVKYCTINEASSNVKFYDDNNSKQSKNSITTTFITGYKNSHVGWVNMANNAEITNIEISKNFSSEAIAYYDDVKKFTDSKKVTDHMNKALVHDKHDKYVIYWLVTMGVLLLIILATLVIKRYYKDLKITHVSFNKDDPQNNGLHLDLDIDDNNIANKLSWESSKKSITNHPLIACGIVVMLILVLTSIWFVCVDFPINEYAEKVNEWNNALKNADTFGNLHVLEKIKEDKEIFANTASFAQAFKKDLETKNKLFNSYWYYSHFNSVTKAENNNHIIDKKAEEVAKDYKAFIDKRKEFTKLSDKEIFKVVFIIIFCVVLASLIIVTWIFVVDAYNAYKEFGGNKPIISEMYGTSNEIKDNQ